MNTTLDPQGRIVVPKALRDRLGLQPGTPLAVHVDADGALVLEPRAAVLARVRRHYGAARPADGTLTRRFLDEKRGMATRERHVAPETGPEGDAAGHRAT